VNVNRLVVINKTNKMNFKLTFIIVLFSVNSILGQAKNTELKAVEIVNNKMELYIQHNLE
jgi:hypothetical protein